MADFKAASSAIAAVKVGTSAVSKVYMGADLVWSPPSSSDWDTYDNGVYYGSVVTSSQIELHAQTASTSFFTPEKLDDSGGRLRFRVAGTTWPATGDASIYAPFVAVYYNNAWSIWRWEVNGSTPGLQGYQARWQYYDGASNPGTNNLTAVGPSSVVYLTQYTTGDYANWSAYDGGTALPPDWTTHEVGAFLIPRLDTGDFVKDFDQQFPLDGAYISVDRVADSGSGSGTSTYTLNGDFASGANQIKSPPYAAVWVSSEHDAAGGYGHNDDGWYVFKRNGYSDGTAEGGTPSDNNRAVYIPHAWKSSANNNDGYLGVGGSDAFPYFVVNLDDYSGTTGSGGTDGWTDPFDWSSPKYTMTATLVATASSNFSLGSVSESGATADWEPYTYQPLRGDSQYVFILMNVSSGGSYSSGNDFFSKTKLQHARLRNTTSGSEYDIWDSASGSAADQYYQVRFGDSGSNEPWGTGTLTYLRWNYNTGDGTTTFAKFSAGDTIQLDIFYTDDT